MKTRKNVTLTMVTLLVFTLCAEFLSPSVAAGATEPQENLAGPVAGDASAGNGSAAGTSTGYVDIDYTLPEDENPAPDVSTFSLESHGSGESLPAAYRSDQVSGNGVTVSYLPDTMRNQNPLGTCWAFSALGACEASLIRKGLATGAVDLSERHLLYYFYNKKDTGDTFGGTSGDYNEAVMSGKNYLSQGGNNQMTMWYLAGWCGPVEETVAPYSELAAAADADMNGLLGQANSTKMAYESDAYHVQNAYMLNVGNMNEDASNIAKKNRLKKLIMEYGALGMSYYSFQNNTAYDSVEHDSYYNHTKAGTNHAVLVVGWDDNFPKENFATAAPGDGAWLMKNSWGEESDSQAQNGYFWISYYDTSINNNGGQDEPTKYAFVFDAEPADNYDYIHQYDGDGSIASYDAPAAANRFTAGTVDGEWEVLRSVGIGVAQSNALCQVEIYRNLTDPQNDPTSGELVATKEVRLNYPGYHTIPLDEEILLAPGSEYSVVFRFPEAALGDLESYVPVFISRDRKYTTGGAPFINVVTYENPDVSFYQTDDNGWADLTEDDVSGVFRIKTYTDRDEGNSLAVSHDKLKLRVGDTARIRTNAAAGAGITWTSSNEQVVKVTSAPDSTYGDIEAVAAGTAEITIKMGAWERTCQVTVTERTDTVLKPEDGENDGDEDKDDDKGEKEEVTTPAVLTGLKFDATVVTIAHGESAQLKVTPVYSPGTVTPWKINWQSTNKSVATVTSTGKIKGVKPGKATIYASAVSDGTIHAACVIRVVPKKVSLSAVRLDKNGKAIIKWEKVPYATGYVVYRSTSPDGKFTKVKDLGKKETQVTLAAVKGSTPYYYKVRAWRKIDGKRVPGEWSAVRTYGASQVSDIKAKALKGKKIRLTWDKASRADGYVIYRATGEKGTYKKIKTITRGKTVTFTNKSLKKGKTYYYKIKAYRLINGKKVYAPYSETVSAKAK